MTQYNKNNNEQTVFSDGLKQINNAATLLYMRKDSFSAKKNSCPLETVPLELIDYKYLKLIEQFVSERGKILPSRITGVSTQKQRALKRAIKQARAIALLPFERV